MEGINHLKPKLARGETTYGLWVTLSDPSVTEIAAMLGFDWVVIDTEHGHLDYREVVDHLRAIRGSTTTPIVRSTARQARAVVSARRARSSSYTQTAR